LFGDGVLVGNHKTGVVCGGCMRKGTKTFLLTIDKYDNVTEQIMTQKIIHDQSLDSVDNDSLNFALSNWVDKVFFYC